MDEPATSNVEMSLCSIQENRSRLGKSFYTLGTSRGTQRYFSGLRLGFHMQNELFTKWRAICKPSGEGTMKFPWDVLDGTAAEKIPARSGTRAALEVGVARLNFDH